MFQFAIKFTINTNINNSIHVSPTHKHNQKYSASFQKCQVNSEMSGGVFFNIEGYSGVYVISDSVRRRHIRSLTYHTYQAFRGCENIHMEGAYMFWHILHHKKTSIDSQCDIYALPYVLSTMCGQDHQISHSHIVDIRQHVGLS